MKTSRVLFIFSLLTSTLFAQSDESMDALLDTFTHKSDLSEKTRLAYAGNVIIDTREELKRFYMSVEYLF
ncbi:MAG: hypothetical protein DRG24_03585 [Epsilonproteobacteria bacterium]|nr:MAG: hypothetical protein DRG24_03585 [Campylobacterota bacterium]